MSSRSIHRIAASLVVGAIAAVPAVAQRADAPKRIPHHEEGIEGPERLRDEIHGLRANVDRLRDEIKQAVAAGGAGNAKALANQAKEDKRHLAGIEHRLAEATPVLDRMRHHASALEKKLETAKRDGDEVASARLEKEIAEVHERIAKVEKARESGEGVAHGREHAGPPSPEAMEKRADALIARAKSLEDSGNSERASALRRAAAEIQERAVRIRNGEPIRPGNGGPPRFRSGPDGGPRPPLPANELQALRGDVQAIKAELREIRASLQQLSKDRADKPAHHRKAGSDGVKHAR
ncbi:MAG: hypothetical protein HYR85_25910 [Planctomycetes bacterium]|nr:hypothetical protein [Planctomycetota bacterium]MBI3848036.1 hypothetical protein [Planctomycetota bacterium]